MPHAAKTHKPPRAKVQDDRPSAHARGYGRRWQALRLAYLNAHPMCSTEGCRLPATDVDHKIRKGLPGGTDDEENLIGYCHSHHSAKTVKVDGGLGNKPKEQA